MAIVASAAHWVDLRRHFRNAKTLLPKTPLKQTAATAFLNSPRSQNAARDLFIDFGGCQGRREGSPVGHDERGGDRRVCSTIGDKRLQLREKQ